MQETWVQSLRQEDPLKQEMATDSSILAWETPGSEEPGGLQFMGSQNLDMTQCTHTHTHTHTHTFYYTPFYSNLWCFTQDLKQSKF